MIRRKIKGKEEEVWGAESGAEDSKCSQRKLRSGSPCVPRVSKWAREHPSSQGKKRLRVIARLKCPQDTCFKENTQEHPAAWGQGQEGVSGAEGRQVRPGSLPGRGDT